MAGRVAIGRQAGNTLVAKDVVLAINGAQALAGFPVAQQIAAFAAGYAGVIQLALLYDDVGIPLLAVTAVVIEMQVRVDDKIDRVRFHSGGAGPSV